MNPFVSIMDLLTGGLVMSRPSMLLLEPSALAHGVPSLDASASTVPLGFHGSPASPLLRPP